MHKSSCPHVITIGDWSREDIADKEKRSRCETCNENEAGLWCCLHRDCGYVGCGEKRADHSAIHFASNQEHSLMINLKSKRIWCHTCEAEVFLDNNVPTPCRLSLHPDVAESDRPTDDLIQQPLGLAGLQNLGNTCYMNAALQALSNCPQLTQYFLNTPISPQIVRSDGRTQVANLAVSYSKMIRHMWHERRPPYAVPSGVAYGIKSVCPVFRGATQQDAQEFLRCFLDQLHDELKREFTPKKSELDQCEAQATVNGDPASVGISQHAGSRRQHPSQQQQQQQQQHPQDCRGDHEQGTDSHAGQPRQHQRPRRSSHSHSGSLYQHLLDEMVEEDDPDFDQNSLLATRHQSIGNLHSSCSRNLDDLEVEVDDAEEVVDIEDVDDDPKDEEMLSASFEKAGAGERVGAAAATGASSHKRAKHVITDGRHAGQSQLQPQQTQHQQRQHHAENNNPDDDFETCDSGLSSEKSEASASDKNNTVDNQRVLETSLCNLLMGEFQKAIASAGVSTVPGGSDSKKPQIAYRSIISDVFDGRLLSSVQCFTCESISSTKEVFQDLSLPIPSRDHLERLHHVPPHQAGDLSSASSSSSLNSLAAAQVQQQQSLARQQGWIEWLFGWLWAWVWGPSVSLTDCLAAFFSADELKGDNMYSCGKCNKLRNGIKYSKLLELPEVLCIHLKRFRHELLFSTKISSRVSFPLEGLEMAPFTHPQARDEVTSYDLVAVICHHGTASSGHYTSYAKNEYDGQWYEFDDTYVTKVDPSVVATCEAYVLFYRKTSEEMAKLRDHAADLIERSQCEQMDDTSPTFYISRRWVNRFNTFAEPGPIDNEEFICRHGLLNPQVADGDLVLFSESVWEYLRETFKGGPAITTTERCSRCLDIQRSCLERRLADFALTASQGHQCQQTQMMAAVTAAAAVAAAGAASASGTIDEIAADQQIGLAAGDVQAAGKPFDGHSLATDATAGQAGQLAEDSQTQREGAWYGPTTSAATAGQPPLLPTMAAGDFSLTDDTELEENAPMETSDAEETQPLVEKQHQAHQQQQQQQQQQHQQQQQQQLLLQQQPQQEQQQQQQQQQQRQHQENHIQAGTLQPDNVVIVDNDDVDIQDDDDDVLLSVERPASIPIDNLLDNVVFKMTSACVTDMLPAQFLVEGTTIGDHRVLQNGDGRREAGDDIADVDSAFCSPMDSVTSREFPSLTPTDVASPVVTQQTTSTSPLINENNCLVSAAASQSMVQACNGIPPSIATTDTQPAVATNHNNRRTSKNRKSREKKAKNRW